MNDEPLLETMHDVAQAQGLLHFEPQSTFESSQAQSAKSFALSRFAQRMVEDARLNAQRVKQRQWNTPPTVRPTQATPLVTALTEAYGYVYTRVHSVGLPLKLHATQHAKYAP